MLDVCFLARQMLERLGNPARDVTGVMLHYRGRQPAAHERGHRRERRHAVRVLEAKAVEELLDPVGTSVAVGIRVGRVGAGHRVKIELHLRAAACRRNLGRANLNTIANAVVAGDVDRDGDLDI